MNYGTFFDDNDSRAVVVIRIGPGDAEDIDAVTEDIKKRVEGVVGIVDIGVVRRPGAAPVNRGLLEGLLEPVWTSEYTEGGDDHGETTVYNAPAVLPTPEELLSIFPPEVAARAVAPPKTSVRTKADYMRQHGLTGRVLRPGEGRTVEIMTLEYGRERMDIITEASRRYPEMSSVVVGNHHTTGGLWVKVRIPGYLTRDLFTKVIQLTGEQRFTLTGMPTPEMTMRPGTVFRISGDRRVRASEIRDGRMVIEVVDKGDGDSDSELDTDLASTSGAWIDESHVVSPTDAEIGSASSVQVVAALTAGLAAVQDQYYRVQGRLEGCSADVELEKRLRNDLQRSQYDVVAAFADEYF